MDDTHALVATLLDQQRDLSAVERFARRHAGEARRASHYRDLIPLSAPGSGEQYAFEVDLDACTGCKACVMACHNLNGLDASESWRSVGLLLGGTPEAPALQTITTSCHHCEDPACRNGCPVRAYEKDLVTGIVRHLDDQCIGCRYCEMMCPYEVPQYSPARGIVRKCDMCHGRLAAGEAPACVQACPNGAIAIRVVPSVGTRPPRFLPDAPAAHHTLPTTRYRSARTLGPLQAADHHRLQPQPAHPPLVVMLTLTQLAVGVFAALVVVGDGLGGDTRRLLATGGLGALLAGLGASVLHLGQPLKAWRVVLGLGSSWMSREIVAFGVLAALAVAYVAALWLPGPAAAAGALGLAVVAAGGAAVCCSAMIYDATGRTFWRRRLGVAKFLGSAAVLGAASLLAVRPSATVALVLALASATKLAIDTAVLRHRGDAAGTQLGRTARLMTGPLAPVTLARFACGALGGIALPVVATVAGAPAAAGALAVCLAGELAERYLFFAAVSPPRMPGHP